MDRPGTGDMPTSSWACYPGTGCWRPSDHFPEILERALQALGAIDGRLPPQELPGAGDIGLAPFRVILREVLVDDRALGVADQGDDLLGELQHGDLGGIAEVHRLGEVGLQEPVDAVDQVADVAEAPRLLAAAVDGDRLAAEGLSHEVGED